jgi:flagellar motor switch protein FliM
MTRLNRPKRAGQSAQVMDPRTLGRPVHLLPKFVEPLREAIAERIRADLNRKYGAAFVLGEVTMQRLQEDITKCRWHYTETTCGVIGFALERSLLLSILDYRYGSPQAVSQAEGALPAETATEERLGSMLGTQFLNLLAAFLPRDGIPAPLETALKLQSGPAPRPGTWIIHASLTETSLQRQGALCFSLDDNCIDLILDSLAPQREASRRPRVAVPLAAQLQLRMVATLYERQVPLGSLLDLKVGTILPISLGVASVQIDNSPLFSAQVAEHKGKLCLTSFEDLE